MINLNSLYQNLEFSVLWKELDYEIYPSSVERLCFFVTDENIELIENQDLVTVIYNRINDP